MNTVHNIYLQPQGDKVILVTVLPIGLFKNVPNQGYVIGTTSKSIYTNMNPAINMDISKIYTADEFCKMVGKNIELKGMGIAGIVTDGPWFCQSKSNPYESITG